MFYHHILRSNTTTLKYLSKAIDLQTLQWQPVNVAIGIDGKLYNINKPHKFLFFNYLNWYEKIRMGLFGIYTLFFMNPKTIKEGTSAEDWLSPRAGKAVTQKIFTPLYAQNKFNISLSRISAKQFAERLHEKEVYDKFTFPKTSYQPMIDTLEQSILTKGGIIHTASKMEKIDVQNKTIIENGQKKKYDILINSIPFQVFNTIATELPQSYKEQISKVKYCPAVCLVIATEELLDKENYWINLFNERVQVIMQHSLLCDTYGEKITWCLRYGGSENDLNLPDEEIKKEYLAIIKKYFPNAKINWVKVMRTRYAEPIYDIDYHTYMPDYRTSVPGLYFTGIQLTYPLIRNMNVALMSGEKVAQVVLDNEY